MKNPYLKDGGKIIAGLVFGYKDGHSLEVGMKPDDEDHCGDKIVKIEKGTHISSIILASGWFIEQLGVITKHNSQDLGILQDLKLDNDRNDYIQIPPKKSGDFGASLKTICGESVNHVGINKEIIGSLYFTFKMESKPGKLYLRNTRMVDDQ